jgi:hypothetical protein
MSLNKKILIIFGVLFFGTLLFVPYVNASTPNECSNVEITQGLPVNIRANVCKKVAPGETESFYSYSTKLLIKNNAQVNYFIPYLTESERYAFLNYAIANPSISVTPDVGNMCFKRCANEGKTCNSGMTFVFYASKNIRYNSNTQIYTFTVSEDASRTRYNYKLVYNYIPCTNPVFGDPRPGEKKYCYYPVTCPGGGIDSNNDGKISTSEYNQAVQTGAYPPEELAEINTALTQSNDNVIMYSSFEYGGHTYIVYKGATTGTVVVSRDNDEGLGDTNTGIYVDMGGGNYGWVDTSGNVHPLTTDMDNPDKFNDAVKTTTGGIDKCRNKVCGSKEYCDSNTGECKEYPNSDSGGGGNTCTRCTYTPPSGTSCYNYESYSC